jgi:hypothetical protein
MVLPMDDDQTTGGNRLRNAFELIGGAGLVATLLAAPFAVGGVLLALAGASAASLITSFAMRAIEWECDAEMALSQACAQRDDLPAGEAPAMSQQPAQGESKQWASTVTATKATGRRR